MSLASNLSVSVGEDTITLDEVIRDVSGTVRSDTARPLSAPRTLTIKHTMASVNAKGPKVDRHLISASDTTVTSGVPSTATVNLSIIVPRDYIHQPNDLVSLVTNVFTPNVGAILRGES